MRYSSTHYVMSLLQGVINPFAQGSTFGFRHTFEPLIPGYNPDAYTPKQEVVDGVGSTVSSAIDKWHAGGGGSRERLQGIQEGLQPLPAEPWSLGDFIKDYWMYGAAAVVGLAVLKKL